MKKLNDFHTDLEYSMEERDNDVFDNFYHRVFPGIDHIDFVEDLDTQKKGIDKFICFKSGNVLSVDEKKRRKAYPDILIEVWSAYEYQTRGWLYKSQCDYIVYAIMPIKKVYLLPVILLKKAWNENHKQWMKIFRKVKAINKGYTTVSYAIPTQVLLNAIQAEMQQEFKTSPNAATLREETA